MATTNIGPKIGIDGEAEFKKQIANINQQLKTLGSEMKAISSEFANNGDAQSALTKNTKNLTDSIAAQRSKIDLLTEQWEKSAKALGENDTKTLKYKQLLNEATAELSDMQSELKKSRNGINDFADAAEDSTGKFDGFKSALSGIGATLGAITAAAGGAAIAMATTVVNSFGELEQNLGGSVAVFQDYSDEIQKVGEEAYKSLGVSQSQYLATANKMGALFQGSGLEIAESYDLTTQAMQRAADMASVMGIDMEMAMESVAGAAKGNFTMMDNLGVAMNATNIEAWALANGIDFVWKEASQADKARVAMQMFLESTAQYAGNFERESTQTITGSLGLLRASVESFVAGLGNANADMQNLTQNMVDAFGTVVENVTPVLENIVAAIPAASNEILNHLGELLPTLLSTITDLFKSVLTTLLQLLPELIPVAVDAVLTIVDTLVENLPLIIDAAIDIVLALVSGINDSLPELIPAAVDAILTIVDTLLDNIDELIDVALELILALADGLIAALPELVERVPEIVTAVFDALTENFPKIVEAGIKLVMALMSGMFDALPTLLASVAKMVVDIALEMWDNAKRFFEFGKGIIDNLWDGVDESMSMLDIGKQIVENIWNGLISAKDWLWDKISDFASSIVGAFNNVFKINSPSKVFADDVGKYMAQGIGVGFTDEMNRVAAQMTRSVPTPEIALNGAASGMINGMQTMMAGIGGASTPLNITLKLDNGQAVATWLLPDLRAAMKADPEVVTA